MLPHIPQTTLVYPEHIQLIDWEFDRIDIDDEVKADRREALAATFYHDGFGLEE